MSSSCALAPELIELIAKFLPTSSDIFRFIRAIPEKFLTKALSTLEQMMLLKSSHDIALYKQCCCAVQINQQLWPNFSLDWQKDYVNNLEDVFHLYSTCIHNHVKAVNESYQYHYTLSDHTYSRTNEFNGSQEASLLSITFGHDFRWSTSCEEILSSANVKKIIVKSCPPLYLVNIIDALKSSNTLTELDLSNILIGSDHLTLDMIIKLTSLSKKLKTLRVYVKDVKSLFYSAFQIPRELLCHTYVKLMFSYNKLSGLYFQTTNPSKVQNAIKGINLTEFDFTFAGLALQFDREKLMENLIAMTSLRVLRITGLPLDDRCSELLGNVLPRLIECSLDSNKLNNNRALFILRNLSLCTRLEKLSIIHQDLSDDAAIALSNSIAQGSRLLSLNLSANKITNQGAIALSQILPRLESIDLSNNQFDYEGAFALSKTIGATCYTIIKADYKIKLPLTQSNQNYSSTVSYNNQISFGTSRINLPVLPRYIGKCYFNDTDQSENSSLSEQQQYLRQILGKYTYSAKRKYHPGLFCAPSLPPLAPIVRNLRVVDILSDETLTPPSLNEPSSELHSPSMDEILYNFMFDDLQGATDL